jgi:hypothetical protein
LTSNLISNQASTSSTNTEILRETLIPEDSSGSDVDIDFDAPKGRAIIKRGIEQNITVHKSDGPGSSRMPSNSTIKQDSILLTGQGTTSGYAETRGDTSPHASTFARVVPESKDQIDSLLIQDNLPSSIMKEVAQSHQEQVNTLLLH